MFRPTPSLLLLAAALAGGCRHDAAGPSPDAGPPPPTLPAPGLTADGGRCPAITRKISFDRRAADVLLLFDRSGSMTTEFGMGTRYSVEAVLLTDLITAYQDKLRFGFQQFPAPDGCAGHAPGCCAAAPAVGVGYDQAPDLAAAIASAAPVGGSTPTAEALRLARAYFQGLQDGIADRYVLLSTDGRPSCDASGNLAEADVLDATGARVGGACADALTEVGRLVDAGVKVIVLGVGPGLQDDPGGVPGCLVDLAEQGGLPRDEGHPWFFSGEDPDRLEAALQQIFGGVTQPSCALDLGAAPADPQQIAVFLDGREIPRDPDFGWRFSSDSPQVIVIGGEPCQRIRRFQVAQIEVRAGCPPCTGRSCE